MFALITGLAILLVVVLWIGVERYRLKHQHR